MLLISIVTVFIFSFYDYLKIKKIIGEIKMNKKMKNTNRIGMKNIIMKKNKNLISNDKHVFKGPKKLKETNKMNLKRNIKPTKFKFQNHKQGKSSFHKNRISIFYLNSMKRLKYSKRKEIRKISFNNLNYIDEELNGLEYKVAIHVDKRNYCHYYLSLLKTKHLIFFSFITNDYNSKIIKIYLFFYTFLIEYTISEMFYTDSTMHKTYI